jgi:hypothetical protein
LGLALQALNWIHQAKIAMKRTTHKVIDCTANWAAQQVPPFHFARMAFYST